MNVAVLGERNVEKFGEYVQVYFEGAEYTNTQLLGAAARLATALRDAGVREGDRVGVMLPNLPEVGIVYGAILRMGAIAMPMVFLLAVPEIRHIVEDSEATFVVTSPEFQPNVAAACEGLANPPRVVVVGDPVAEGCLSFAALTASADAPHPILDRTPDDLAVVMYTSGTTGRPKGVMLSHGNLLFNSESVGKAVDLREGDCAIHCLPLAHLFGLSATITGSLFKVGAELLRWFTAEAFFEAVNKRRATSSAAVPTMLTYMLAHPGFDDVDWSSFRWIVVAAAPVPVEMSAEFEKRTGARVLEGYGLTETSPTVSIVKPDDPHKLGTCGRPLEGVDVVILDDDDKPVATGETGEVCARGPNIFKGYYRLDDVTAEAMRGGWFHTGDMGHLDEDGYLHITERKKDLIIRAGFNIFPRDVEEVIYGHAAVQECAVVGVPDPKTGEEVVAYVVLRPGGVATEEEIASLCRANLAKYKTPKYVLFTGTLPKNPIGKILKRELRDRAVADLRR